MNKFILIMLMVGWAGFSAYAAVDFIDGGQSNTGFLGTRSTHSASTALAADSTESTISGQANVNGGITMSEVANHNTPSDCWLVIHSTVYDVTDAVSRHPGGADAIVRHCGEDATVAFSTKDNNPGRDHSRSAYEMLAGYEIGMLGSEATVQSDSKVQVNDSVVAQNAASVTTILVAQVPQAGTSAVVGTVVSNETTSGITAAQVATHGTRSDCWVIMESNVYDVTNYIVQHPGGANAIINYCGSDLTAAFNAQGHSSYAHSLFSNYLVGPLDTGGTSTSEQAAGSTTVSADTSTPYTYQHDHDHDHEEEYEYEYEYDEDENEWEDD